MSFSLWVRAKKAKIKPILRRLFFRCKRVIILAIEHIFGYNRGMKIYTSYRNKIKHHSRIFRETVDLYRRAVRFFVDVMVKEDLAFSSCRNDKDATREFEAITLPTKSRPAVRYDFNRHFYKMPCYLRRAAIAEAFGMVSSYRSNLARWEETDPETRGRKPRFPQARRSFPVLYKGNMYDDLKDESFTDTYRLKVKAFIRNTWDWVTVELKKTDVDYIRKHCMDRKMCSPVLMQRGKEWFLDFPFEETVSLPDIDILDARILAVDLGLNNACTLCIMDHDGAVLGRHFLKLPGEYDRLGHAIGRIKKAQKHGARKTPRLWARANGINDDISVKTASFIMEKAEQYGVDVIVFEHLDTGKKKSGSRKQKLALWKARYVQAMVCDRAHRKGMRVSRVCAWNTSRLAFDGSGRVLRGKESGKTNNNYSLCEFTNGKLYNCDLNASYNIGSRYFVRELCKHYEKSMPATSWQGILAKAPGCLKRSTCTLSTLISLSAAVSGSSGGATEGRLYGGEAAPAA